MPFTPIPQNITQPDIDAVKAALIALITQITALNNTNTALTKDERREGVTVGPKRKPFTDYYFTNKNNYASLKPSQTAITEVQAESHYLIASGLEEVKGLALTAIEMITDIQLNSEHHAFQYASKGRLAVKTGKEAGLPGADSFFDALDALFPQSDGPNTTQP